jgi:hypothetical protein
MLRKIVVALAIGLALVSTELSGSAFARDGGGRAHFGDAFGGRYDAYNGSGWQGGFRRYGRGDRSDPGATGAPITGPWSVFEEAEIQPILPANRSARRSRRNASMTKSTKVRVLAGSSVRVA